MSELTVSPVAEDEKATALDTLVLAFAEKAALQDAEYQPDGPVDLRGLDGVKAASEISQPGRVNGAHLIDEHAGPCSIPVDLGPEDSGLRARGGWGDDHCGQRDPIALDGHCISWAALLMPGGVFRGAQPVEITTH